MVSCPENRKSLKPGAWNFSIFASYADRLPAYLNHDIPPATGNRMCFPSLRGLVLPQPLLGLKRMWQCEEPQGGSCVCFGHWTACGSVIKHRNMSCAYFKISVFSGNLRGWSARLTSWHSSGSMNLVEIIKARSIFTKVGLSLRCCVVFGWFSHIVQFNLKCFKFDQPTMGHT